MYTDYTVTKKKACTPKILTQTSKKEPYKAKKASSESGSISSIRSCVTFPVLLNSPFGLHENTRH